MANVLGDMDRHAEAAAAYGEAIARSKQGGSDSLWTLYLLRAASLEQADRWTEAKAELETAMKLEPDNPLLLNFLGYGKLERGEDLDAAEAMIRKASALRPDDASITDSLGWALYKRGRLPEAIATLTRAAAGDPAQSEIHEHLGDALFSVGPADRGALLLAGGADHRRGQGQDPAREQAGSRPDPRHRRALMRLFASRPRPSSTSPCTSRASCPTGGMRWRRCSPSAPMATGWRPNRRTISAWRSSGPFAEGLSEQRQSGAGRRPSACGRRRASMAGARLILEQEAAGRLGHWRRLGRRGGGAALADAAVGASIRLTPARSRQASVRTCPPACSA